MIDFATIDFETYYDKDYTLSKMQTDEYIKDPRFEIIGVSAKPCSSSEPTWFSGTHSQVKEFLQDTIDWRTACVNAHHTHFDGFICTQVLGLKPKMWLDTLSLARMHYPWLKRHGLAFITDYLGIGKKGHQVITYKGYRREDFTPQELRDYGDYCDLDVSLEHTLAKIMLPDTPALELLLIDMKVRMFTEPRLKGDTKRLLAYYDKEVRRKQELLARCGIDVSDLMSAGKLAEVLQSLNVDPPTKISPRTGKVAYAFAKSDKAFTALKEHPDADVQAVVAARLGVKSTIAETRAKRLVAMSRRGLMPVYLQHWGAKTTGRDSGGDKMNWQNLPARGDGAEIRRCLVAPSGYKVVVGDSSNIELRFAMCAAGQTDVIEKIKHYDEVGGNSDVYCDFATELFGRVITKEKKDKRERDVGKMGMLLAQYYGGDARLREAARVMIGLVMSEDEAKHVIVTYRSKFAQVKRMWWHLQNNILPAISNGQMLQPVDVNGWFLTDKNGFAVPGYKGIVYHDLRLETSNKEWTYEMAGNRIPIHGGKVLENLCQHGSRHIVFWQAAKVHQRFPVSLTVHDEIVCVVKEDKAEECKAYMEHCLATAPAWCRGDIPLKGEVHIGDSYGEAK